MNKLLGDLGKKLIYGFGFGTGMGISFHILRKIDPEEKQFNRKQMLSKEEKIQDKEETLEIQNTQIESLDEINDMYLP
tara:strand:- start:157 stop:390 length:234 start_codon:yes stop_codon:yes gene_type:complete